MVYFNSILSLSALLALASSEATLHRELRETLQIKGAANVIVRMKQGTKVARETFVQPLGASRGKRIAAMRNALKANAQASQKEILNSLSQFQVLSSSMEFESLWISNEIFIRDATMDVLEQLQNSPNVAEIYEENIIQIESFGTEKVDDMGAQTYPEWGLNKIKIPQVWDMGMTGKGIKVGGIDTGVQGTHEALAENFVGIENYGWYDALNKGNGVATDVNGHGTHTMGTIVGKGGIGVAPDAQWMACSAMWTMLCPHDIHGENEDCSLAPHVVSNSWGGGQGQNFYDDIIDAWRDADIIPVFAMGNSGHYGCGTANSPGDNPNVIAVGSTSDDNSIAFTSSRGPPVLDSSLIKPDIVAPGEDIRSAWPSRSSDSRYNTISGTSMACPHVSGVIALMLEEYPEADYDFVFDTLMKQTMKDLNPAKTCGEVETTTFPNFVFGNGLIDGFESCNATVAMLD